MDTGIISPAMMNLFKSCPLKFYFKYIEGVSAPNLDKKYIVGKNIHALASYYLKNEEISPFLTNLSDQELAYFNYLKQSDYFKYEVVGIEKSISIRLAQYWIGGRIDAVVKNNKDYYILDYKTGGVSSDMLYDFQTMIYLLTCNQFYNDNESLSFVYIDLKNSNEVVIKLDNTLKSKYEEKLLIVCDSITKFNKLKFNKKCNQSCEYAKLCVNY